MIKNTSILSEEYLDYLSDKIICIHEDLWKEIVLYTYNLSELPSKVKYVNDIKKNFIGYCKDYNRYSKIWWEARGWKSNNDIEYQIWKYKKENKRTNISAFSQEFWIKKGYTVEEAEYKRNSIRPIRKEYWLERGFSETEAIEKAKESKDLNNKKGLEKMGTKKPWTNDTNIRYYLELGYSYEDSKKLLKERQTTFSLETCVEKYGEKIGIQKWKERQEKWQNTLNSKSKEEIDKINKSKSPTSYSRLNKKFSNEEIKTHLKESRNIDIVLTTEEFIEKIENTINKSMFFIYTSAERVSRFFPKIQYDILGITDPIKFVKNEIDIEFKTGQTYKSYWGLSKSTPHGFLRSSYEIYFYDFLNENGIEFLLDKHYPNSSMRYDFFIKELNEYIELCPMYDTNKDYRDKMIYKKNEFGAVLLKNMKEIEIYLDNLKKYYENDN